MSETDRHFMRLALDLAKQGKGRTAPNPCVGAVVVTNGEVVGTGWHRKAGTPHAEVHALAAAGAACLGATLYVTLEPCNHTGRTPPCSQAVLAAGIKRVVIGMMDPHPLAAGGAAFLRSQGVMVETGILEQECRQLNYPFIKHATTGLPWVVMKAGLSLDGKISQIRGQGGSITGPESQQRVHVLRNELDAILIGIGTALIDNPALTCRLEHGRDPVRVLLDSRLRLPADAQIVQQKSAAQTWIFCRKDVEPERQLHLEQVGAVIHKVDLDQTGQLDLHQVLSCLGKANITSLLVEGGSAIHGAFLRARLVDQAYLFLAPYFIGDAGTPLLIGNAPEIFLQDIVPEKSGKDILLYGLIQENSKR